MKYQNRHDDLEESGITDKEEASPTANFEKLNSCWFVLFKYLMLIAVFVGLKNLISPASPNVQIDTKLQYSTLDNIRLFIDRYPLQIWDIVNCALVFEGLRRKNLDFLLKAITSMQVYIVVQAIFTFLNMTSEAGLAAAKEIFQKKVPDMKPETGLLCFFALLIIAIWCFGYYLLHVYGAKKARDVLRGPRIISRSI